MEALTSENVCHAVRAALAEDIGPGDATTQATIPAESHARGAIVAREPLVVCGLVLAETAFRELAPDVTLQRLVDDGRRVEKGTVLLRVRGPSRALLTAERVALNFVQRLSGIATLTAQYVEAIRGTRTKILDTRKTTPGLRRFEKYAVACGGGANHRFGLYDQILIKDNHLAALRDEMPNAITAAILNARDQFPQLKVEVEADTLEQVQQAVEAGADVILLDNMTPAQLRQAVALIAGRARTEASGGITLQTVNTIAHTGVDYISVGALTHSAPSVDIALDFEHD